MVLFIACFVAEVFFCLAFHFLAKWMLHTLPTGYVASLPGPTTPSSSSYSIAMFRASGRAALPGTWLAVSVHGHTYQLRKVTPHRSFPKRLGKGEKLYHVKIWPRFWKVCISWFTSLGKKSFLQSKMLREVEIFFQHL